MNILNINERVLSDHTITNKEYHTYLPYANTSLNKSDEIRIPIQTQDIYTFPAESFLEIEGVILDEEKKPSDTIKIVNNAFAFLFDEIRYELGGAIVDRVRNPGITALMKGYVSFTEQECLRYQNAGWNQKENPNVVNTNGYFNVCIPLKMLMGVFEDFKKVVVNIRQELVLIRSFSDTNCVLTTKVNEKPNIQIDKVTWKIEHVKVDDEAKLKLLSYIEQGRDLTIAFRGWELHEYPLLQQTMKHSWNVKSVNQLEKPRYIIFGFQTGRKNQLSKDASRFDHCNLTNFQCRVYIRAKRASALGPRTL